MVSKSFQPKPKRSLGQVFLKDHSVVQRMAETLKRWQVERVLEIGPGPGVLTNELLQQGFEVTAVEKDDNLAATLTAAVGPTLAERLEIVHQDVLSFDMQAWAAAAPEKSAVVGNIPYNISSPILTRCLPALDQLAGLLFMTQAEFANRAAASAGNKTYGSLSVYAQLRSKPVVEFDVGRESFKPVPKVDSAVISFVALAEPLVAAEHLAHVEVVTRTAFSQRRKQLRNSLKGLLPDDSSNCPIDLELRPERLTPSDFVRLAAYIPVSESL